MNKKMEKTLLAAADSIGQKLGRRMGKALTDAGRVPNAKTIRAMKESRRGGLPSFKSLEALMADLSA